MAVFKQVTTKGKAQQQVPFKKDTEASGPLGDLIDLLYVDPQTEEAAKGVLDIVDSSYKEGSAASVTDPVGNSVAAAISKDQDLANTIKGRAGDSAYTQPNLSKEQEREELEGFARVRNKSVQDVATDPALYEEFGRHLGKVTNTLNDEKYFRYNADGSYPEDNVRVPTPWVDPQYVSQVLEEEQDFFFKDPNTSEEEDAYNAAKRTYNTLNETLNANLYGPAIQDIISKKMAAEGTHSAESIAEFMTKFVTSYASIAEQNPNAGRAWSDIMFHSVLAQTRSNKWKSRLREEQDDHVERSDRDHSDAMTGIADDMQIGHMILDSMGATESSPKEKSLAGSLARNIVSNTFSEKEGDSDNLWEDKLFEIEKVENKSLMDPDILQKDAERFARMNNVSMDDAVDAIRKGPKTNYLITLTSKGEAFADRLQDLTDQLIPSSVRDVRYTKKLSVLKDVIPRGHKGLKGLPHGALEEKLEHINVAESTPVTIHTPTAVAFKAILFNENAVNLLNGPKFLKIKGDGNNNKGTVGRRAGYVLRRNSRSQLLDEAGNVTNDPQFAEKIDDMSDTVKDSGFKRDLQWAERNAGGKPFYYDFFYGVNNRMSVDQTVGNFQHSKVARALIAAGIPSIYSMTGPNSEYNKTVMKAGIMKRFGFDKKDVEAAAREYDGWIGIFQQAMNNLQGDGGVAAMEIAGDHEGWASIAAMAEAVEFQKAIDAGQKHYSSGFLTEVDGLTNGMAHSAWQSGDVKLAGATNLFSDKQYMVWKEGDKKFDDAYELLDDELKGDLRWLWSDEGMAKGLAGMVSDGKKKGFKGIVTHQTSFAFKGILEGANSKSFRDAMSLIGKQGGILGRSFAKKPVMIFGYGAGPARILESVETFMRDLWAEKPHLRDTLLESGIDIENDFILPLGVAMAEAVGQKFGVVKQLGNALSTAASIAYDQDFTLSIPTTAGYRINLGKRETMIDPESRTKFSFATGRHTVDKKTAEQKAVKKQSSSYMMMKDFHYWAAGNDLGSIKAASQITVMLNHANDSININRAISNMDKRILARGRGKMGMAGNTALQVFDGLFVTPLQAGEYTKEMNDVFRQLNVDSSHVMNVFDALTFELGNDGMFVSDPVPGARKPSDVGLPRTKESMDLQRYKRRLKPLAAADAEANGVSTWDSRYDKDAFDWHTEDIPYDKNGKFKMGSKSLRERLFEVEKQRKQMDKDITHIRQFFWDKSSTKYARK
jgi:hypothetical protein